ncbi:hypothetical protein Ddye_022928 [Dipteronia dyeriana]|uniref:RNase H type-1 domain-containing protein n=1 Tax=Dipteronia dyeriana TaxID=168575 RepID=A0AAD9TS01_9ROSI|nr:hypothetical protein Ddye_022928 [Dipteronia dyeriana]
MGSDGFYLRCEVAIEDTDHLLRGCSYSVTIWDYIFKDGISSAFYASDTIEWVRMNLTSDNLLLAKDIPVNHPLFNIANGCSALINSDWRCLVSHVYREGNKVVDGLARMGHGVEAGLQIFEALLLDIWLIFQDDWNGCAYSRSYPSSSHL